MAALLTQRLAAIARDGGAREALVDGSRRIRYAELWSSARAVARFLLAQGLQPGERVALVLPNGVEAVAAMYGAWLAGGIVVPLSAQGMARELGAWLAHCEPAYAIFEATNAAARETIGQCAGLRCRVAVGATAGDAPRGELEWPDALASTTAASERAGDPPVALRATDPALILYTSGTTGAPKGVTLSHDNLAANAAAIIDSLQIGAADSVVSLLPFHYAYGNSVLHTHLAVGARVVLEHSMAFPRAIVETISRERATGFSGVASTYALLLARDDVAQFDTRSLRYLTQAGSAMPAALVTRVRAALPHARLFMMYGQTEATARLTCLPPERLDDKAGSVGVAIAGTELQVRDEHGQCVPTGTQGDIWARGGGVMLGYWRDAGATRQVLVDGWLRTGDVGHLDADGFLYLAGRRSDIIKTGAHRVSPQDVEEVVAEFDGVAEVAAVGVADALLGEAIKVFIVPAAGATIDALAVKAHCRARLAAHKIPKQLEVVTRLPRTASGKVRRVELKGVT